MRRGILTIHTAFNYGAMLQAYALQAALIKLGHDALIIDYYPKELEKSNLMTRIPSNPKQLVKFLYARFNPNIHKKIKRFNAFRNRLLLTSRYIIREELYQNIPDFDVYMIGSDQVWNMERSFDSFWFLDFAIGKNKVSYASSFGTTTIPSEYKSLLKEHLTTFSSISTREVDGVNIINEATGLHSKQVVDPTFLLNANDWNQLAAKRQIEGDYILCYGFDNSEKSRSMVSSIKKRLNLPLIAISISISIPYKVDRFIQEAGPLEFLSLIKNAKFVCTSSYHGMALAINYRKSFYATLHPTRNARMESMLNTFGLKNRQLNNPEEILNIPDEELFIDYTIVEDRVQKTVDDSIQWLKSTLNN